MERTDWRTDTHMQPNMSGVHGNIISILKHKGTQLRGEFWPDISEHSVHLHCDCNNFGGKGEFIVAADLFGIPLIPHIDLISMGLCTIRYEINRPHRNGLICGFILWTELGNYCRKDTGPERTLGEVIGTNLSSTSSELNEVQCTQTSSAEQQVLPVLQEEPTNEMTSHTGVLLTQHLELLQHLTLFALKHTQLDFFGCLVHNSWGAIVSSWWGSYG